MYYINNIKGVNMLINNDTPSVVQPVQIQTENKHNIQPMIGDISTNNSLGRIQQAAKPVVGGADQTPPVRQRTSNFLHQLASDMGHLSVQKRQVQMVRTFSDSYFDWLEKHKK
jgi:hypothetical protein